MANLRTNFSKGEPIYASDMNATNQTILDLLAKKFRVLVVDELPEVGQEYIFYLVPSKSSKEGNTKDEYVWTGSNYERIGTEQLDTSNLLKKTDVSTVAYTGSYNDLSDQLQAGTNIQINNNTISAIDTVYDDSSIKALINTKQNQLTVGTGVKIENDVISINSDNGIAIYDDRIDDANKWLTNGYVKTGMNNPTTINLPGECVDKSLWGVLLYVAENNDNHAGMQQYFPIDGTTKGRIYYRSVTGASTPLFGEWHKVPWYDEFYLKSEVDEKDALKQDKLSDTQTLAVNSGITNEILNNIIGVESTITDGKIEGGKIYKISLTNPTDILTINSIENSHYETDIFLTIGENVTSAFVSLPADYQYIGNQLVFEAGKKYVISIKDSILISSEIKSNV